MLLVSAAQHESAICVETHTHTDTHTHTHPRPTPLGYYRAPSWASFAMHAAASHSLSILHMVVYYVNAVLSVCPTLSFPCCGHKSFLYAYISIPALQVGSSVLLFWISYICVNIWCLFFSFCLHCMWQILDLSMSQSPDLVSWVGSGLFPPLYFTCHENREAP